MPKTHDTMGKYKMTDDTIRLVTRLIKNGIRFQYLKRTGRPGRPQALTLEITHHCIARCIMCNIWKISSDVPDLPMADWIQLLDSALFSDLRELDITGGEPFTRKDLPDLFSGICKLRQDRLKRLKSVAITTNGLLTGWVLEVTENVLQMLADEGMELVMVCAVDAVGEIHDRIRNVEDAWSKVNQTIEGLVELRGKFPNLIIGLKTTILPINVEELENIAQYANLKGLFTITSPCIFTEGRYLNMDRTNDLRFSQEDIDKMIRFFRSDMFRWSFHADTLVKYFERGVTKKPCTCGFNYFFIRSTGDLFLCPLIHSSIGNVKELPLIDLFLSEKASKFRRQVGKFPECRQCTEPGLERYALPYAGFPYLALLSSMGKQDFIQLHRHMGLDKYLS
jgi:MoaA/NifB/PqqE/SkfB family radical SAM enzyme